MATLIRLKRKNSSSNDSIVLAAGEPYYNLIDKRLYVGNTENESVSSTKKHIAEVSNIDATSDTIKFQLGEDESNIYEKTITDVEHASQSDDVTNLSLSSSSESTVTLTWGPENEHSTSFTIVGENIGGTITSARNVTTSINSVAINEIFETDGKVVKKATQLNTARTIKTNLSSTSAASFNGTANVTPGVSGTLPITNGGTGATTAENVLKNLGITATATELNYTDGVTSNIQTQLDNHTHTELEWKTL